MEIKKTARYLAAMFLLVCNTHLLYGLDTETQKAGLVDIQDIDSSIVLDIRYATKYNFTGHALYPSEKCYLRRVVAEKLKRAQEMYKTKGLCIKIFDCYRPLSVQKRMWELIQDERYVANPAAGSKHNRAAAVDLTLLDAEGNELDMGTGYDDFTPSSAPGAEGISAEARKNRAVLVKVMTECGFKPSTTEWWHYDSDDWEQYDILDTGFPQLTQ
ncbi:MAG: D-alanyl-D-alanine dipeptidase [Candidatus Omnitrophota bacterium]|jgi:D-alanyl-D-alanine dipeptidase|nr:MAG: D-alanyl-D-alanine dipeptidase [Candidatus Omnitrophota bacterium]